MLNFQLQYPKQDDVHNQIVSTTKEGAREEHAESLHLTLPNIHQNKDTPSTCQTPWTLPQVASSFCTGEQTLVLRSLKASSGVICQ